MLIKYEFLKILRKKYTLIVMAVSLILTGLLFGLPTIQYQAYNHNGVIKGEKGISYEKEQYANFSVPLSEKYVTKTILDVQKLFENHNNIGTDGNEQFLIGDAYWNEVAPREKLLNLIANTYAKSNENQGYNTLPDLDIGNKASFYQAMERKRNTLLNSPSGNFSNKQKEYWNNMSNQVEKPLQYGYYEGWAIIISCFELLMLALLAICIVIAPVFSGEYQTGTDAVILSAKYGKTKLSTAKVAAAILFATIAFVLHIIVACGLPLITFGIDGWNLPLQIANTLIPYPLTFLQAVLINIGIIYLVLLAMVGLTLFLSARMQSPYLVLIIIVPVILLPMFLTPNGTTGAYNMTLFLLPYRAAMPEFDKYISYQLGNLVLDALTVRGIIYSLLAAIMPLFAKLAFKKHQVV